MEPQVIADIKKALQTAITARDEAGRGPTGRHLAIVVTELESALLRAKLACGHNGLKLLPE